MRSVEAGGLGIGAPNPPRVMGVLNVSVESPYDPSVYADPEAAAEYVDAALIDEGADIVDIGLESANRRLEVLDAGAELDRLSTAIETMELVSGDAVFSIETRYADVAEAALQAGFDMVNDVCGFADPAMPSVCRKHDVPAVKMASPPDLDRPGAVPTVDGIFEALSRGELTEQTIVDPAFGRWCEEKTLEVDAETFDRLPEFRIFGRPVLASINRKNFLRKPIGRSTEAALPASLAATAMAVERGVDVFRTHDVAATVDAVQTAARFRPDRVVDPTLGIDEVPGGNADAIAGVLERCVTGDVPGASGSARTYLLFDLSANDRSVLREAVEAVPGAWAPESSPQVLFATSDARHQLSTRDFVDSNRLERIFDRIADSNSDEKTYTGCP